MAEPEIRSVAIAGCGIGRAHIEGYLRHPDKFHVAALCDVDKRRLAAVGDEFTIGRRTTSLDEILRMDDVDIVDICTPPALHVKQTLAALAAGKEVVCEKPLAGSLAEIDRVLAAEKAATCRVMPIFSVPLWQRSAKGAADHRVGDRRQALPGDCRDRLETDREVLRDAVARAPGNRARWHLADARDPHP